MGHVKRSPKLASKDQQTSYRKLSKADIIEAYRDIFRQMGGCGELDDIEWMKDLNERVILLKTYREQWKREDLAEQESAKEGTQS